MRESSTTDAGRGVLSRGSERMAAGVGLRVSYKRCLLPDWRQIDPSIESARRYRKASKRNFPSSASAQAQLAAWRPVSRPTWPRDVGGKSKQPSRGRAGGSHGTALPLALASAAAFLAHGRRQPPRPFPPGALLPPAHRSLRGGMLPGFFSAYTVRRNSLHFFRACKTQAPAKQRNKTAENLVKRNIDT